MVHLQSQTLYIVIYVESGSACGELSASCESCYLAREGAEVEGFLEDSVAGQADVAGAFGRPGLWPWLQEHHFGTVDGVRLPPRKMKRHQRITCHDLQHQFKCSKILLEHLHKATVHKLLEIIQSNHIVVDIAAHLNRIKTGCCHR